ncbi:spore coat protein [Niallia sp.]|uniref:spore coat protein n=1 Tax=Niallia sp. TaxID=2837523 RepID=UPI00289D9EFB|nr:spore coat protein [Niallia sp.]
MQNHFIHPHDVRRIRPGFGIGRPGFGRPGFGGAGFGLGLGLLGGFATGALLAPALYGGYGYPPYGYGIPPYGYY